MGGLHDVAIHSPPDLICPDLPETEDLSMCGDLSLLGIETYGIIRRALQVN
jgi:hypothetical protein